MPKRPDATFSIPAPEAARNVVLDLLGGVVRRRPLTGEEALAALNRLEADAAAGDAAAQTAFARTLLTDSPDSRKNRRALLLLRRAVKKDLPQALHLLGLLYLRGQGLAADREKGAALVIRAATAGLAEAELDAAKAAKLGFGVPQSDAKALYWWRLAGAQGKTAAQREAGLAYLHARGTAKNYDEAAKWLRLAALAGDPPSQFALARLHQRRDWPNARSEEAVHWMKEAAFSGIVEAQYRLGIFFWAGHAGKVDLREAVRWLCRAAENGSATAMTTLAGFLMTGNALPLNRQHAYTLLSAAAGKGDAGAAATAGSFDRLLSPREKRAALKVLRESEDDKHLIETLIPRNER